LNIDGGILNELEEREKNNNTHWVNKKYACCAPSDPKISNNW
jgi:hypothetical protein